MIKQIAQKIKELKPAPLVHAHCDGPCGVYDPASARIAAEAVLAMTKKIIALKDSKDDASQHTLSRYIAIKEEQAHVAKTELLILWTDYFKPPHLEANPNLHETFWQAAKLCSACKVSVSLESAEKLMAAIETIHGMFWGSKNREVAYYTVS